MSDLTSETPGDHEPPTPVAAQVPLPQMASPRPPAGWYPDPSRNGRRYWNGAGWTAHTQELLLPVVVPVNDGTPGTPKSSKLAFVLGLLFGPIGMLYTTLAGFAAMAIIGCLGLLLFIAIHFPLGFNGFDGNVLAVIPTGAFIVLIAFQIACAFWACTATPAPSQPPPPYDAQPPTRRARPLPWKAD